MGCCTAAKFGKWVQFHFSPRPLNLRSYVRTFDERVWNPICAFRAAYRYPQELLS